MSVGILLLVGIITAFEFFYILYSMNEDLFLTVLGYKAYIDAIFGFGITAYMAISGTISGVIIAAFSGLMFSLALYITYKFFGCRKRVNGKWLRYDPSWTWSTIKEKLSCFLQDLKSTASSLS